MGSWMWSVLNQMRSRCFLRNFRDAQEELLFPFKCTTFFESAVQVYFSSSSPAYRQSFSSHPALTDLFLLSLPFRFALVLSWCCIGSSWPSHHRRCAGVPNDIRCSALWEIKPTCQLYLKDLISRQRKLCQIMSDCCIVFFTMCWGAWAGFNAEHSKHVLCNVVKCFVHVWLNVNVTWW